MGLEVYFDRTGKNNEVKLDPTANAVKIDPSSNSVRATLTDNTVKIDPNNNTVKTTPAPPVFYPTVNVAGQIPPPFTKDKLVVSTSPLTPGWYEIYWMVGLAGRAANVAAGMASNMRLKVGSFGYSGVYSNSDKEMGPILQPRLIVEVPKTGDTFAQILVVNDDKAMTNAADQFYLGVINATRIG